MENAERYTFLVDKKANKVEIGKAVEAMYGVKVAGVNTLIMPSKPKSRYTKRGVISGRTQVYKKAIVTLLAGDKINYYDDI